MQNGTTEEGDVSTNNPVKSGDSSEQEEEEERVSNNGDETKDKNENQEEEHGSDLDEGANANHIETTRRGTEEESQQGQENDDDQEEGTDETPSSESLNNFFKLLPYFYLMNQRNLSLGEVPFTPGFELTNSTNNTDNNGSLFFESPIFRALLQTDPIQALRMFQQLNRTKSNNNDCANNNTHSNNPATMMMMNESVSILSNNNSNSNTNRNNEGISEEEEEEDEDMQVNDNGYVLPSPEYDDEPLDLTRKDKERPYTRPLTIRDDLKLFRTNPRSERGYTSEDLEAALQDIQTGKLGTRRAAVIYGIPRSTLRNKVYKLGGRNNGSSPKTSEMMYHGGFNTQKLGPLGGGSSFLNGHHNQGNGKHQHGSPSDDSRTIITEMGNKIGQHSEGHSEELSRDELMGPKRFKGINESETVLEMYRMMSGLTGRSNHHLSPHSHSHPLQGPYSSSSGSGSSTNSTPSSIYCRSTTTSASASNNQGLERKSRPKRGKYRNYDKEALARAVQAVQNGEMSVHRAGSYFGVPHSTLEYKVKERHLLRQANKLKGTKN